MKDQRTQIIKKRVAKPVGITRVLGAWKPRKVAKDHIILWRAEK